MELPSSHEPHRYASQDPITPEPYQESFDGNTYYTAVAQDWQADAFPASPSATSTLSGSDGFSTPRYIEQQPLPAFCLAEQSLPVLAATKNATSHPDWNLPMVASNWQEEYRDAPTWTTSQTFVAQPWHVSDNFYPSSVLTAVVPSMPQVISGTAPGMAQSRFEDGGCNEDDDDDDNDDDFTADDVSDFEDCADEDGPETIASSMRSMGINSPGEPMMKVHKFPAYTNQNHIQPTYIRPHVCDLADKKNPEKMCGTRFVRPEHLRRHKNTVHVVNSKVIFKCKVPKCNRSFNRGDNLRDHYFTHVERGGRAGKNTKMALEEMKKILGPGSKNKELYIKLVKKYRKYLRTKRGTKS
jgi:hypothetical protein